MGVQSLKSSFQIMDGDGNNELDFGEFCHAMRLKQTTLARKLFQMYDRSGDGQIQMHEFIAGACDSAHPSDISCCNRADSCAYGAGEGAAAAAPVKSGSRESGAAPITLTCWRPSDAR